MSADEQPDEYLDEFEPERVQRLHPPEEGQEWADGWDAGFSWVVVEIDESEVVHLLMFRDDEPAGGYLGWPRNRWRALVERQRLTLVTAAGSSAGEPSGAAVRGENG